MDTDAEIETTSVAAAYGNTVSFRKPTVTNLRDGIRIVGSDLVSMVTGLGTSTAFDLSSVTPIHPAYWSNSTIGNNTRTFGKYRYRRLVFEFVTALSTGSAGSVVMTTTKSVTEPALNAASAATFLSQAMSTGAGILTPIWKNAILGADLDEMYRLTDPLTNSDLDDQIVGELLVYSQSSAGGTVGYVIAHYECEFIEPSYTLHSGLVPIPAGNIGYGTFTDSANEVTATAVTLVTTSGVSPFVSNFANGAIFKFVLNLTNTAIATGNTAATVATVVNSFGSSNTVVASTNQSLQIVDGMALWGVLNGSNVYLYISLETAVAADLNGLVTYGNGVAFKTVWAFFIYPVRGGARIFPSQQ
jgi:hypothetical protein